MLDARNIYREISRAIYDFSLEQQKNIAAIVWLYRSQGERFLELLASYIDQAVAAGLAAAAPLAALTESLKKLASLTEPFATQPREPDPLAETWKDATGLPPDRPDESGVVWSPVRSKTSMFPARVRLVRPVRPGSDSTQADLTAGLS